jgi:hypothetical protein
MSKRAEQRAVALGAVRDVVAVDELGERFGVVEIPRGAIVASVHDAIGELAGDLHQVGVGQTGVTVDQCFTFGRGRCHGPHDLDDREVHDRAVQLNQMRW